MATILVDTREHQHAIEDILASFDAAGIRHVSTKLYVGDYQEIGNGLLVIDRKQNLSELVSNVCQQHERFRAELERAKEAGVNLVILCEHGGQIRSLDDVASWSNPRLKYSPKAMTGERLHKVLKTIEERYGVQFVFCNKKQTGRRILEILGVDNGRLGQSTQTDTGE